MNMGKIAALCICGCALGAAALALSPAVAAASDERERARVVERSTDPDMLGCLMSTRGIEIFAQVNQDNTLRVRAAFYLRDDNKVTLSFTNGPSFAFRVSSTLENRYSIKEVEIPPDVWRSIQEAMNEHSSFEISVEGWSRTYPLTVRTAVFTQAADMFRFCVQRMMALRMITSASGPGLDTGIILRRPQSTEGPRP